MYRLYYLEEKQLNITHMTSDLNKVHSNVLNEIERSERNYKMAFFAVALVELAFLVGFILLADFTIRLHLLLFISTLAIYTIVIIGVVILSILVRSSALKVIHAVEASK